MSVNTKGFLYGENKENFNLESLIEYMNSNYIDVKMNCNITDFNGCVMSTIAFIDNDVNRCLYVFEDYKYYNDNGSYPLEINDQHIIVFDIGSFGNSVDIISNVLKYFGGGYLLENDCNDDWRRIISTTNNQKNVRIIY